MGLFNKAVVVVDTISQLPIHSLRSSYGIVDCPKCAAYIHVKYHTENGCRQATIPHLHCICRCGYQFVNHPNDAQMGLRQIV